MWPRQEVQLGALGELCAWDGDKGGWGWGGDGGHATSHRLPVGRPEENVMLLENVMPPQ